MPSLRVIPEGGGQPVETDVLSRNARVIPDNQDEFAPAVVERVEYDHSGQTSSITSVCGETENRRESSEQPELTVEGILTEDQLPDAKSLKEGQEITFISDVHQGQVYIKRLTIEQSSDIIAYINDSGEEKLAFTFQLQLGQPGGNN
jgi:hypothetical protein